MKFEDNTEEGKNFLRAMIERLEEDNQRGMPGTSEQKKITTEWAMREFRLADEEDRAGLADQSTARSFYAAGIYLDVLRHFGNPDEDMTRQRIYCKWKAKEILTALKEGRTPTPGGSVKILLMMGETDRDALLALYRFTDGANWNNSSNCNTDAPLSDWYGVKVNGEGRVLALSLGSNDLRGRIPVELGDLRELKELWLSGNQLTGSIPPELGMLAVLETLSLRGNQLSGGIPPELGELQTLKTLSLWNNQLSGSIPPELGKIGALETLNLSDNRLSGPIPPELGALAALQSLVLWNNQLSGTIPEALGNLTKLKELWLNNNQLTGSVPPEIGNLGTLQRLYLYDNQLCGGPEDGESVDSWRNRLQKLREDKTPVSRTPDLRIPLDEGGIPCTPGLLRCPKRTKMQPDCFKSRFPPPRVWMCSLQAILELWEKSNVRLMRRSMPECLPARSLAVRRTARSLTIS
eukprot:g16722.t1